MNRIIKWLIYFALEAQEVMQLDIKSGSLWDANDGQKKYNVLHLLYYCYMTYYHFENVDLLKPSAPISTYSDFYTRSRNTKTVKRFF